MDVYGQISLNGARSDITKAVLSDLPQSVPVSLELIKGVFSSILGAQTVASVVQVADSLLVKEQVLGQCAFQNPRREEPT